MRNGITGTGLVVLVTVLLLVSESALVQSEPVPETKSVGAWLKEWGEDVHYNVTLVSEDRRRLGAVRFLERPHLVAHISIGSAQGGSQKTGIRGPWPTTP